MATLKDTIKSWFQTGLKPTQEHFWAWMDSFWHKDEKIPITAIDDIEGILDAKADAEALTNHISAKGVADGYAPLNELAKIAAVYLNIVDDLTTGGSDALASAETVKTLKGLIDEINVILGSDNVNLNNVQELVDAIETVQTSLSTILINDLTTGGVTKALTAEQGKVLKGLIDIVTAWGNHALAGYLTSSKTYKTYFINTSTGNNATGVYEDASKPFASIDYVTALPSYAGGVFELQNAGVFTINNTLPCFDVTFKSDVAAELVLSGMTTTFLAAPYGKNVFFDMPFGKVTNNKSGGAGTSIYNCSVVFNLKEIYHFSSSPFISDTALLDILKLNIVSVGNGLFISTPTSVITTRVREIFINQIVCLQSNSRLIDSADGKLKISIGLISGSGSFLFHSARWDVGDITTTGTCSTYGYIQGSGYNHINFRNSIITSTGGISLGGFGLLSGLLITGNINSCPSISGIVSGSNNSGIKKFLNFSANLGTGTFNVDYNTTIFENCSIKSTNSPITIVGEASTAAVLEIKNSTFEVVNAVPLLTGGAGGTNTVKIAGVSTNATVLSDQNGTGVTVTQYTNY